MWDVKVVKLGKIRATSGVIAAVEQLPDVGLAEVALACLFRHAVGDWGEVPAEDQAANDHALVTGERLLSAYTLTDGTTVWVILVTVAYSGLADEGIEGLLLAVCVGAE
jgi:hypothetical protein